AAFVQTPSGKPRLANPVWQTPSGKPRLANKAARPGLRGPAPTKRPLLRLRRAREAIAAVSQATDNRRNMVTRVCGAVAMHFSRQDAAGRGGVAVRLPPPRAALAQEAAR